MAAGEGGRFVFWQKTGFIINNMISTAGSTFRKGECEALDGGQMYLVLDQVTRAHDPLGLNGVDLRQ